MNEATCKSCGKKVAFVKDDKGKVQILDLVAPVYEQTTLVNGVVTYCERSTTAYVSHFATCPNASKHSKKKS